ncbi:unnamed protein product [Schistosoma haematobium]|nr:unnamed protein product [Schistosoma haematobium]
MYPIDARSPQSIVRETSRLSSRTRSESIPCPALDAITQIGVTTKTSGTQISDDDGDGGRNKIDLCVSKRQFVPATIPERKQVRNAITQIGVSKVDAGTQDDYHEYSPKRSVKEVLCQIGQITANASCQTLEHYKLQQTLKKPTLDAIVQSGVITKNNSTQSESITETVVKMDVPESQKGARKYSVLDAICQIGQVTQTIGTQIEIENTERNKKNLGVQAEIKKVWQHPVKTTEAACQIGRITINASTEMSSMIISNEQMIRQDMKKSDIVCQIGKVQIAQSTQADLIKHMLRKPSSDVVCQVGSVMESSGIQIDEPHKTSMLPAGTQSAKTPTYTKEIQTDMGFRVEPKFVSKAVNDVICQVGQVNHEVSTQSVEHVTARPAYKDTGIDPIHVWEKKMANDVVTQTGIVHTSKITQAELIQEQPVYVKPIETQDVPITSYKETVDAYQQADLIKHMLRKPSSDVVCQVGSVMESSGIQIDEPHKTSMLPAGTQSAKTPTYTKEIQTDMGFRVEPKFVSKAVNDVICQVGQVNHEVSTQSVEHVTARPAYKDTGIDPIHVWEKKMANDVVTQTGIVHTSKITQAELIQEQPVYVKPIETQDVPITSYKETVDAYQQADLIKHMLRKPSSDVVCQVGSVMESSGIQIDEPHKTSMLPAGTQSAKTPTYTKEIQTDMGFRVEPKFVSKAVNDVICQVGQVNHEVSTQSVEHVTARPAYKDTGIDPIHVWEKKMANDVVTQTGIVHTSKITQAELIQEQPVYVKPIETQDVPITSYKETVDAYQQADLIKHMLRKPSSDVVCQVGSVMESSGIQIDEPHKTSMLPAGTQSAKTPTYTKEIQTDMGFRVEPKFVSKAVNDVICQVGQVNHEVSTQSVEHVTARPAYKDTGIDPIHVWEKKMANDVVTQTGIVHTSKITQAELIQEQPVYVKPIETQDVPITSYKETVDAYQQADLIKHMLRKPSSDVICQVGSVMESSGIQIDEPHKTSMLPAGTQSAKTPTYTKEIQTDMGFRVEPKFVSKAVNDVICQVGQVNHEVSTQSEIPSIISVGVDPKPEGAVRHLGSYQVPPKTDRQSRQVQADIKQAFKHTNMQTEEITRENLISTNLVRAKQKETFDVTTQFGILTKDKDVETFVKCSSKETQTIESSPEAEVKMRSQQTFTRIRSKNYDVQTQSGTINISQAFQTLLDYKPTTDKRSTGMQHEMDFRVVQTTHHEPQTQETPTQTERVTLKDEQSFTSFKLKTYDVQTQFGSMLKSQAAQTPGEQRPVVEMKDMITQHEKRPEPIVHKKLQAMVQPTTINTETQTMEERPPPVILPPKLFDVQTQSGSVTIDSETQTPQERRPVIEMKELLTQHEKRPVPTVHKKLQAMVQPTTINTETQTMEERPPPVILPPKLFDVQTQSGSVTMDSETQTPLERRPVVATKDASVHQETKPVQSIPKKLQATVVPPLENMATQTDLLAQPVVMPMVKTTHHEPQTQETPTQTERVTLKDEQSFTSFKLKTYDVQTQFGSMLKSQAAQTPGEQRPVVEMKDMNTQHEKRPEPIVHKKLQAMVQPTTINTETQTMEERPPPVILPPKLFDVQTQSGSVTMDSETQTPLERRPVVATKDASVHQETKPVQSIPKKLQATVVPPLENMATQTDLLAQPVVMPMVKTTHHEPQTQETPTQTERVTLKDEQSFTSFKLKTYDVQTQFGSMLKSQAAQTPGEQRPVVEMKDMITQHEKRPEPIVHKKLQAMVQPTTINTETQTMEERPPPVILPPKLFDVQTQSGSVTIDSETQTPQERRPVIEMKELLTQHEKRPVPTVHKKLQAMVQPTTINTETQTMEERPPPVILPPKLFDVQTQSGSVTMDSETQTPLERRPVVATKDASVHQETKPVQSIPKKLQATVVPPLENMATQTDLLAQPVVMPMVKTTHHEPQTQETPTQTERVTLKDEQSFTSFKLKTYDVQTQFGSMLKSQAAQTPGEQRPVVEIKDMITQHEKRPEPIVHKKLQAMVQPTTINTETQTMEERPPPVILPPKLFDVQTQSGSVTMDSETQTPLERRPVVATKDASVHQETKPVQSIPKKLQATVVPPLENMATQTDLLAQPVVMPMVKTTHHEPQTQETPTQTERVTLKDEQSFTSFKLKTYDVQTQFGSMLKSQAAQTPGEQRPVVEMKDMITQHEKRPEPIVHKKLQAMVQPTTINTETQTMEERPPPVILPPKLFDVQTQSGSVTIDSETQTPQERRPVIEMKELLTQHEKRPVPTVHKKLQAMVQPTTINTETQTMEERPPPVILPPKLFDVQTQSGSVTMDSETQTPLERRPVVATKDASVHQETKPVQSIPKKLQATVVPPLENMATQTDLLAQPVVMPMVKTTHHEPQTQETPTQTERVTLKDEQSFTSFKLKTYDVQTQFGSMLKSQAAQTPGEQRPVVEIKDMITQHEKRPEPIVHKKLQAMVQPTTINTETQTMEERPPPVILPPKLFDVQTQSGSVTIDSETQTPHKQKIIPDIKDVSVFHESHHVQTVNKKLQAVVYHPSDDVCLQTEEVSVQPVKPVAQVFSRAPQVAHKQTQAEWLKFNIKTFDIQAQSGMVVKTQSTQTILEEQPVFHTADVSVIHSEKSPSLVGKKVQATMRQSVDNTSTQTDPMTQVPTVLPKTTFDVVTQSGTIHCAQSVQTIPEERPVFHTADVSVIHSEKSPSLVGKKVQATMRQSVDNTSTQTDPMTQVPTVLPKTTFDVVTQSGTVHCAQSVQTIPEERPVFHTADVSVIHSEKSPSLVGKKVQATMRQSVDNTSTQTDPMTQVPTVLPKTTFDVVTQSGTIHCAQSVQTITEERPLYHTVGVGVDHTGKLQPVLYENVQATMRQSVDNTSTQTDPMTQVPTVLPKTTFDVVTQSGTIHCAQSVQTILEERPRIDNVDVSVDHFETVPIVRSTISSTMHTLPNTSQSTQTTPTKLADTFCQATLSSTTYDVQIQSGVMHSIDGTQTVDLRSPIEMKEMSVAHEKERTVLKGKKLQVRCDSTDLGVQTDQITPIVRSTISSTMHTLPNTSQSTQTTPTKLADTFCQATLSSTTYDVQIQSGVMHSIDGTQTVDLRSPIEMKEMSVAHEKERTVLKGKKLQVRCDSTDLGVQTDQITPIVRSTISSTMHTLPNTSQSTQTTPTKLADTFCQATLSSTTYDVQIQSGVMHSIDGTQTVDLRSPIEMKEMSVAHEKERTVLKGKKLQVHCDSTDLGVQTDHTMSTVHLDSKLTQTALVRYTDISCQYTELTKPSLTSHAVTSRVVSIQTDVPFSTNVRVDQRNKKFQVNLISPSSPKTLINVASIGTQTSDYRYQDISIEQVDKTIVSSVDAHVVHDSASNVTNTSQAIPKIKIDQECQVKITPQQYQKKLQYGSSFSTLKNTSSQTIQDSCLYDHHKTSSSSSIGVQASNIRPVVTVDTGTQETRPSETSPSPLQVKNKKLQVYPSKLGEQVEEEFTHPQDTISKGMSTSLTEITQTDECLLKNIECFKCISRGYDKKTIDKDMQSEEKSIRTKQTASSTVKSNYFTRILQMETIPDKPKASDTSDVLKLYRESGYRARGESKNIQTDTFLLGSIQLPESREVDSIGKISKKTTIVQLEKLTTDKCVDTMPFEKGLIESQISYHDTQISERRNIKLLKETPWSEAQVSNVLQDIQYEIRHPQIIDSSGSYSPQQNSVAVSARPTTHMLAHTESTSRNGNGKAKTPYQYLKPDVVSWGVQFAPVTLTGVTQTTESSKHKLTIDSPVNIGVQTDAIEDDYYIKRVVTTIARKGLSSYCRRGPVAKRIVEHTDLLTSSLPSNLDEEFDEETTIAPRTTKVTTMQKRGDRRVVHEELLTEDYRERGSSLDSHVAHERFLRETHPQEIDLHGMHEHETGIYTDAEICLQNLLKVWGEQYLLSRLRTIGRYSGLSVSLDRSIHTAEKSRLVEAKTQFTSTGNLVSQIRNLENMGTQTSDILLTTRPPHKNKRIQRGRSFISGGTNQPPPTRSGSVVSPLSPTTEELTSHHRQHGITSMQTRTSHPFNLATTTFTETTQEQSTFSIEHTVQTYICPTCGSQASIPVTVHSQIQPQTLPITQLKDAQSQTRFVGQMTADNNCTYLPTYLSDEEVIRINQSQKIEDREFSVVTWHPAEIRDTERRRDSDTSNQIRDEVWVDSPGKLLELKITGVIVPGTSKIVSASEAFYRGLLRVVYWDYEKLGPRQSSVDSTVSIPLADAVISKAVRLASDRISTEAQPSLDAKIVWRTPEIQRSRYLVHSIRPDAGQNKHNPINLDVASAIRAGLIDKETGRMLFTHSVYESPFGTDSPISKKGDSSSDQTERLSVREAILRGFLVAELIEPESSYITKQSLPFIVPSTSYSHSPTDVDI